MLCLIYPPTANPLIHNPALNCLLLWVYYYNRETTYNKFDHIHLQITILFFFFLHIVHCHNIFYIRFGTSRCVHQTICIQCISEEVLTFPWPGVVVHSQEFIGRREFFNFPDSSIVFTDGNFQGFLLNSNLSSQLMPSLIPTCNKKHKMSVHSQDDHKRALYKIRLDACMCYDYCDRCCVIIFASTHLLLFEKL